MFGTYCLPVLSTVPRSGTWFLRYLFSFVCHLEQGGRLDDLLTGEVIGNPQGAAFDFDRFRGGPLFRVAGTLPTEHMFIGHTICPGFQDIVPTGHWWRQTSFHVPGYDCFHEEKSYRHTPVDLANYDYAPVKVPAMERAARKGRGAPIALVYRNPVDQAYSYFRYCQCACESGVPPVSRSPGRRHVVPGLSVRRGSDLLCAPVHFLSGPGRAVFRTW